MMKKTIKLASLTFLMFGCAVASEFRPPMVADRGPQRIDMNVEREASFGENWELDMYSTAYSRNANKTFTKHGSSTAPLSTLIFGKDNFKLSDLLSADVPGTNFPGTNTPMKLTTAFSQEFNANANSVRFYPRVTYSEQGVNLGAKLGYKVLDGKGTLGLKVNVPLKTVRMERDDNAETVASGNQDSYVYGDVRQVTYPVDRATAAGVVAGNGEAVLFEQTRPVLADYYKLSAVAGLPFYRNAQFQPFLGLQPNAGVPANFDFIAGGQAYSTEPGVGTAPTTANFGGLAERNDIPFAVFYNADSNQLPLTPARAMKMTAATRVSTKSNGAPGAATDNNLAIQSGVGTIALPIAAGPAGPEANYILNDTVIAAGGSASTPAGQIFSVQSAAGLNANTGIAVTQRSLNGAGAAPIGAGPQAFAPVQPLNAATNFQPNTVYVFQGNLNPADTTAVLGKLQANADNLWLMTVSQIDGITRANPGQNEALKGLIQRYGTETAEQWLWRNGFTMATDQRTGLGDITVTPYYDHVFNESWQVGAYMHLLIPTGGSNKTGTNPYKARLGNDNHVEIGGGLNAAFQAFDWFNVRADVMGAYAVKAKEKRALSFKDATVKGIGPVGDADVDYARMSASIDATFVHPKASNLATTIGYEFGFKSKDKVSFKSKDYTFKTLANDPNSWFGGFWLNAPGGGRPAGFYDATVELDSAVQEKNTEAITHNFKVESSWHATEQLSIFCGASTPVWGQYVAKMQTMYGGMNVKF